MACWQRPNHQPVILHSALAVLRVDSRARRSTSRKSRSCDGGKQAPTVGSSFTSADVFTRSRPTVGRREHRQRFWEEVARGLSSEKSAVAAGVSPTDGARSLSQCGGMPTFQSSSFVGALPIVRRARRDCGSSAGPPAACARSARQLGRSPSTFTPQPCDAERMQHEVETRRVSSRSRPIDIADRTTSRRPKVAKLAANRDLEPTYAAGSTVDWPDRGSGTARPSPTPRAGSDVHGRRHNRRSAASWVQKIANRLRADFLQDQLSPVSDSPPRSHLPGALRSGRSSSTSGAVPGSPSDRDAATATSSHPRTGQNVRCSEMMISERPAEADFTRRCRGTGKAT